MIPAWVLLTVAAAFLQNIRSLLQKQLTGRLSVLGATYVRFLGALPFAWLYLLGVLSFGGQLDGAAAWPTFTAGFYLFCLLGAVGQMAATLALLAAFQGRSFAGATALSKTETAQAAAFGLVLLGDPVTTPLLVAIGVSLVGVFLLGGVRLDRSAWLGLWAGAGLAVAAVAYRAAAQSLGEHPAILRAALALAVTLLLQSLIMGAYIALRERGLWRQLWQARAPALAVGLCGAACSVGWFTALALATAAQVRVVGQIELVFAFATSVWLFRERISAREIAGALLVVGGIVVIV